MRLINYLGGGNRKPWRECIEGLQRLGPTMTGLPERFEPDDVLVTWSPFRADKRSAAYRAAKAAGARAIIMENGWLSPIAGIRYFQVAFDGWNGTGQFPSGGPERWHRWGVPLRPWRESGGHVLVIGQKKNRVKDPRRMPIGWAQSLRLDTDRPIIRRMPGSVTPLADDLHGAYCTIVWTSTTSVKGLIEGIPAFHCGPNNICPELSKYGLDIEHPIRPDRLAGFERAAWCQWNGAEIATGEPFARLLALPHDGKPVVVQDPPPVDSHYTLLGRIRNLADRALPGRHPVRRWFQLS